MKLLIAILRQNISVVQIVSFVLANLFGGFIVLIGLQTYLDADRFLESGDSFLRGEQIVISKPVSGMSTVTSLFGLEPGFTAAEIEQISQLPDVSGVGPFTAVDCRVRGQVMMGGMGMTTDMFLESVPDEFIDVSVTDGDVTWTASLASTTVPVIIPRAYLNLYNFGFASTRSLPQMGEGMMMKIPFQLYLSGNGQTRRYDARIVGFSSSLNTILVPQQFVNEVNGVMSDASQKKPSRLAVISSAGSEPSQLLDFIERHHYVIEGNSDAVRMQSLVHGLLSAAILVGLLVSALAFYLLVVSIHLLIEKNRERLATLSALGYPVAMIARPYQLMIGLTDMAVWLLTALLCFGVYPRVSDFLKTLSPDFEPSSRSAIFAAALGLALLFVMLHSAIIHREIAKSKCRTSAKTR